MLLLAPAVHAQGADHELLWQHKTGGEVDGVSASADGKYIVAGSVDDNVYFFANSESNTQSPQYSDGGAVAASTTTVGTKVGNVLVEHDKINLSTGASFDLKDGYGLTAYQIDFEGQKVWLGLSRYGTEIDDEVLSVGDTYSYTKNIDNIECLLVKTKVGAVFRRTDTNIVQLVSTYQYQEGEADAAAHTPATTKRTTTDWPMFRGDITNSGYTSESLTPPLKLAWKAKVDGIVLSSPVVSDGLVYVGSTGTYVYALEENSGKQKWKYKTGGWIRWSPAVANEYIYVSSEDGYVYALDKNTGELKWKKHPRSSSSKPVSSPIVAGNLVYVLSKGPSVVDSGICALDASTGNLVWCKEGAPETLIDGASPAISNGILYVGIDNSLFALNAKDGDLKWAYPIEAAVGMPIISNGMIYVGTGTGLHSIDANAKKAPWDRDCGQGVVVSSSPSIANNMLHLLQSNNGISIVNTTTGISSGSYTALGLLFSSPTISNKVAYIGSGQYLEAVDAQNGMRKWNYTVGSTLSSSPAIANGRLFIGSDGYVYAFEKSYRMTTGLVPPVDNKHLLFEGYSLVFSKYSFEDGDDIVELAKLELQKNGVEVDSGTYKQGSIVELGNKGLPIIKGNLDIFIGSKSTLVVLKNITIYSESGDLIISNIGKIIFSMMVEQGTAYWKLDDGYWLYSRIYPHANQAVLHLQKYNLNIDTAVISVGKDFSLENDTETTILSGTLEDITEQDRHIMAKFTDVVQHSGSRIASKTISNLTADELKNIISEKKNEPQPAHNLVWDLSDGYSLYLAQVDGEGEKLWLLFRKDGQELDDEIVTEGEQFSIHKKSDRDVTILSGRLDSISLDPWYVTISDVRLYSESGNLLEYVESFDVHSAIASAEKSIDIAKGISADTSEAESLLQQARDKRWNGEYTLAMSYANKAEALVFDVDNDGVPNNEDFAPITPNNYVYGGVVFSLISLVVGINTTRKVRSNRRVRIRQEAKDAITSFSGGYSWCKSGKLYSDAKKALDSSDYSKANKLARKAKELCQKELPLVEFLKRLKDERKLSEGISESLIKKAEDEIRNSMFNKADKLLKKAEKAVEQENHLFVEIDNLHSKIPEMYQKYIEKTTRLLDECLNELKDGNFKAAESSINKAKETFTEELDNAKYEKDKMDFIEYGEKGVKW